MWGMGYDYDGAIRKLEEFRTECEATADAAEEAGRHEIAAMRRRSADGFADLADKMRAARDAHSA